MPYPAITSRRIPYDIDGVAVGYSLGSALNGIASLLTSEQLGKLNDIDTDGVITHTNGTNNTYSYVDNFWLFFPEKREIEAISICLNSYTSQTITIKGSNDTSNGMDGTWETATFPNGTPASGNTGTYWWRNTILPVSFSTSYKTILISFTVTARAGTFGIMGLHLYGRKAAGETIDDILFCDVNGNEITALTDWGDRPEGTTLIKSFKVKNASTTKIANNINLQLNHADFLMSLDQVNWVATIDIASIPANSLSAEIFLKNPLGVPPLTLGPKAARIIATVGSFT